MNKYIQFVLIAIPLILSLAPDSLLIFVFSLREGEKKGILESLGNCLGVWTLDIRVKL